MPPLGIRINRVWVYWTSKVSRSQTEHSIGRHFQVGDLFKTDILSIGDPPLLRPTPFKSSHPSKGETFLPGSGERILGWTFRQQGLPFKVDTPGIETLWPTSLLDAQRSVQMAGWTSNVRINNVCFWAGGLLPKMMAFIIWSVRENHYRCNVLTAHGSESFRNVLNRLISSKCF